MADPALTRDEILHRLRTIRALCLEILAATDSPAIARSLEIADMYSHMAEWQLGEVREFYPAEARAPARPAEDL